MHSAEAEAYFVKGMHSLQNGDPLAAMVSFDKAVKLDEQPVYKSFLAYCLARERGQVRQAIAMCEQALEKEPDNTLHYLNLGRIHLVAGNKPEAIRVFRAGLGQGMNHDIIAELDALGTRNPPIFSCLKRDHPLNRYLGIIFNRLRWR